MNNKNLIETLRLLQGGAYLDECSERLAGVIRNVEETGKAGKLTITLDVKKVGAAVSLLAKVTDKTPEKAPDADLFYATVEGNLTVDNPAQQRLKFAEQDAPRRELRDVTDTAGPRVVAG